MPVREAAMKSLTGFPLNDVYNMRFPSIVLNWKLGAALVVFENDTTRAGPNNYNNDDNTYRYQYLSWFQKYDWLWHFTGTQQSLKTIEKSHGYSLLYSGDGEDSLFLSAWSCSLYWSLHVKCCNVFTNLIVLRLFALLYSLNDYLLVFLMKISASIVTNQSISMLDKLYKTLYINHFYNTENES